MITGVALFSAPALAQVTAPVPDTPAPAAAVGADGSARVTGADIIVTGSRIARPDLQASSPISVVTSEALAQSGQSNVEQYLNELPQVAPGANASTNNGSDGGIATIDLRDLGPNRTLVLVNGRRFVASNNLGWVDLNNIPAPLVERVDIVTGGASAVYGSDAVAGVVNFILKNDFEGIELGGQYRLSERGDAQNFNADITLGGNFADGRGNAVLFASYNKRKTVLQGDRAFSRVALGDVGTGIEQLGSSRVLSGIILDTATLPDGTAVDATIFQPDGTPIAFDGELFNFAPLNYLQTPQERFLINGLAHFDINDSITFYTELFYANNRINLQLAADANDIPEPSVGTLQATIANPLFNPALRTFLSTNYDPDGDGIASIPAFRRRMAETGGRRQDTEHDVYRILGGVRGDIGDTGLHYDAFYSFARTNRTEILRNYTSDIRIQQGLLVEPDPASTTGGFRCADLGARSGGCVPISVFGAGVLTPEGAAFISPTAIVRRSTQQQIAAATLTGDLFDLGAGPVGFAVGGEYRRESSNNLPDSIVQSGELGPGSNEAATRGSFNVKEVYAEINVPLIAERPFFHELTLEAAGRYSDYSTVGTVWTYKAGGQWAPVEGIRFRGLYQRAVRAPNVYELFQGTAASAEDFDDPCAARNLPDASLQAFCVAQGVPAALLPTFIGDPGSQATTILQGEPSLREEKSTTYTAGVVIQPPSIPGFSATIDYYKISVRGAIDDLDSATTSQLCFDSRDLTTPFCQAITRNPVNGIVDQIIAVRRNLSVEQRQGIDWQAAYRFDFDALNIGGNGARVAIQNIGNYSFTNRYRPVAGAEFINCNGRFGSGCTGLADFIAPRWRTTTTLTLGFGDVSWQNQVRVISKVKNVDPSAFIQSRKIRAYWDTVVTVSASDVLDFTLGVDNVLDKSPPIFADSAPDANTDASLYDVFGRSFFISARARF